MKIYKFNYHGNNYEVSDEFNGKKRSYSQIIAIVASLISKIEGKREGNIFKIDGYKGSLKSVSPATEQQEQQGHVCKICKQHTAYPTGVEKGEYQCTTCKSTYDDTDMSNESYKTIKHFFKEMVAADVVGTSVNPSPQFSNDFFAPGDSRNIWGTKTGGKLMPLQRRFNMKKRRKLKVHRVNYPNLKYWACRK